MPLWKWRVAKDGEANNGLSEGETGSREMSKVEMADGMSHLLSPKSCRLTSNISIRFQATGGMKRLSFHLMNE